MVRARKGRVEPALQNNEETNPVSILQRRESIPGIFVFMET